MKTLSLLTILAVFTAAGDKELATINVDTDASTVVWTGYHLAKSYQHTGNVKIKSGSLEIASGKLAGGSFVIDMTSISNSDLEKEDDNAKLVNHLKSADFFNVSEFPEAKLTITSVNASAGDAYDVNADITIRGITKPITFQATKAGAKGFSAKITVNRTEHEVMYGWKLENAVLGGDFDLEVNLVLK